MSWPLKIVKLSTTYGPKERPDDGQYQKNGQRNQKIDDFHENYIRDNRAAFSTTTTELADIPTPASQGGTIPARAAGIASIL